MENVQPWQVFIPFGIAAIIGVLCLIWGDRPELAAAIRKRFEERPRDVAPNTAASVSESMSSTKPVSLGIDTDTAGIAPGITLDIARLARDLTEDQLLELLLRRKRTDGEWRFSGKKLFTIWGGNYNAFVARSMAVRAGDDPPEEPLVPTPIAGRPTKASYYQDTDLEYQPLPR